MKARKPGRQHQRSALPGQKDWHPGSDRFTVVVEHAAGVTELDIFVPKATPADVDGAIAMARETFPQGTQFTAKQIT